ncbi:RNA-binding S4 domain-containing protein [Methyloglobulus sp.]|uniref:RNA-binding S4 domain-containing protein n=1 Tax=Methyloglobulus sp. TaxID=2518622 RepID=UPI0039890E95
MPAEIDAVRLDKWLWAARFYKTRKLATNAITGGKVHVNGQRTKPGKDVKIGTEITVNKSGYTWEISIAAITGQRRSAKDALLLYLETPESFAKRQHRIQEQREQKELFNFTGIDHKPNKKERRLIHRFKQG